MFKKIVVGDASDQAGRDSIELAGRIAEAVRGRLTVVFPYHPLLARETSETAQARVLGQVCEQLKGIATTRALGTPSCHWTSSSWPIHALHELAEYERAELIVFGAARETLGNRLRVSLMERMVHGAPCAVAVAPPGYARVKADPGGSPSRLRRIGVGFSSSKEGLAAIVLAGELAGRVGGTVRAIAGAGLEPALASHAFSSPTLAEIEAEMFADTERTLVRVCEEFDADNGIPIEHETVRGDPSSVLLERSRHLDMLVLGSRAYGPLRHVFLGSVSAPTMREAHCPVLVVPRGVEAGDGHAD
jgi:nucleotide-binding universal stress UspA family protein